MTWPLNDKEFQTVLSLPIDRRYAYFAKRVADNGEVWGLWRETGWVLAGNGQGRELLPIWPHPRYAEACAEEGWLGAQPRAIEIHEFLERWVPGLRRDNRKIAVFPTPSNQGIERTPEQLKADVEAELELIE